MRYSKVLKLGAVGLALLLIPRRSSRHSERNTPNPTNTTAQPKQQVKVDSADNDSTNNGSNGYVTDE